MAKRVNIHEAKTHLSRLVERVENGEDVVICRNGKPAAKLSAIRKRPRAKFGFAKGTVHYTDETFAPMSEEELKEWYDGPIFPDEGNSGHTHAAVVRSRRSKASDKNSQDDRAF